MSRPFTYSDENFTVIGNILFIHYQIGAKSYNKDDTIGTIPPAIYDRLLYYNVVGFMSNNAKFGGNTSSLVVLYIDKDMNLKTDNSLSQTSYPPRFINSFIILKDI